MAAIAAGVDRSVHVVGIGAQTPVGRTAPASAAAVRAGICCFTEHPYMTDAQGEPVRVACAPWLSPDLLLAARIQALIQGAAEEALSPLLAILSDTDRPIPAVGVVVGISDDRPGLASRWRPTLTADLLQWFQSRLPRVELELCSPGHTAGVVAIQRGCQLLLHGEMEFCLVGGADSHLAPENLLQLVTQQQVHGEDNPWGFIPGEAGGFCLLATKKTVRRYRLTSLLEVVSVAVARESNTNRSRTVCTGIALSQAVGQVLRLHDAAKVDVIVCDQNGEPYRADEFGFTLVRHARHFNAPPNFCAPAACWGDVGAASGPLFAGLVAASGQRGYAAGQYGLLLTSSETEERGAVLVRLSSATPT